MEKLNAGALVIYRTKPALITALDGDKIEKHLEHALSHNASGRSSNRKACSGAYIELCRFHRIAVRKIRSG